MLKVILKVLSVCLFIKLNAQPIIEWSNQYGGGNHDYGAEVVELEDGSFLFVASTESNDYHIPDNSGKVDLWYFKLSSTGELLWSKTFGGSEVDLGGKVVLTPEGSVLFSSIIHSQDGDITESRGLSDTWLLKVNTDGEIEQTNVYGGSSGDNLTGIFSLKDGNYLLFGMTYSSDFDFSLHRGDGDAALIKINASGDIIWSHTYGGSLSDGISAIKEAENGDLLLLGDSESSDGDIPGNKGETDVWIARTDKDGNLLWSRTYGGTKTETGTDVLLLNDGYIILGNTNSDNEDVVNSSLRKGIWVFKTNLDGKILWNRTYGGSRSEFSEKILDNPSDNSFYVFGVTNSSDGDVSFLHTHGAGHNFDLWLLKISYGGILQWEKTYGDEHGELPYDFIPASDGGFIMAGSTNSDVFGGPGTGDLWIVKLAPSGIQVEENCNFIQISPNPVYSNQLFLEFENPSEEPADISVFDASGKLVTKYSEEMIGFDRKINLELPENLSTGVYFLKIDNCQTDSYISKFIKMN